MHIAICNDNVADRKQLERLLSRESDKRTPETGNLYVDSFGHPDSMLKNPMQFDAFFIDMENTPDISDLNILSRLVKAGCSSPVVLFYSTVEEKTKKEAACHDLYANVFTLKKPVMVHDLSDLLDNLLLYKSNQETPIELRSKEGTRYVYEHDIVSVEIKGSNIDVTLKSGETISHTASLNGLLAQLESYPVFFFLNSKMILNARHILDVHGGHIVMCDGRSFRAFGSALSHAKKYLKSKLQQ